MKKWDTFLRKLTHITGLPIWSYPTDFEDEFCDLLRQCEPFSMTSMERLYSVYQTTKYIVHSNLTGAVVECGVWRGGSMMMAACTLLAAGDPSRQLFLYDTFAGMSAPTDIDADHRDQLAIRTWARRRARNHNKWCYAPEEEVRRNMGATGYPTELMRFVKGKVEDTVPGEAPDSIALLRLDTDWYESTYHALTHLYPRVTQNGILIIDDYGHWKGARQATDQFFAERELSVLLNRIDYTGRLVVKTHDRGPSSTQSR